MNYWLGVLGTWIFADGVASLWTYLPKKESWLRNHSFRLVRMVVGVLIILLGWLSDAL